MYKTLRFTLMLVFALLLGGNALTAQEPVAPDAGLGTQDLLQPAAPLEDPETLVAETSISFVYGGGFLYWETDCIGSVESTPVYIRRQAENGLIPQTLFENTTPTHAECERVSRYNVADDSGYFYVNYDQSRLEARLSADPDVAINLANLSNLSPILVTDAERVYYNQSGGIYRSGKDSFGGVMVSDASGVTGLAVDDTYIYWLDAAGLWRSSKTCTSATCWNNKEQISTAGGEYLTWKDEDELLWIDHSAGYWRVRHKNLNVAGSDSVYWAPDSGTLGLGRPVYHDGCYFWPENTLYDLINPPNNFLRRMCNGPGSEENIGEGLMARDYLAAGALGLLFADGSGIYQVPFDAEAITKDFVLEDWEVTQGIQDLYNTVDLVAKKTTYVRVFGSVWAERRADAVQVELRGYRGGVELADSPLQSVNGPHTLTEGEGWNRTDAEDGWLFKLPTSWTASGTLHLEAEIDPYNVYADQDLADNTLSQDFVFHHQPPLCIVFIPVRTHEGKGSTNNPYFGQLLDRAERLLPVPEVHSFAQSEPVEEFQICWKWGFIPYPCFGPYELDEEGAWHEAWRDDESSVIDSIATRWLFSDDPDVCDDAGANTHYVGMVHPDSPTMNGTEGMGRMESYASWIKFPSPDLNPPQTNTWAWPRPGGTLAHELGHNYNRYHVNCGGPDDTDSGYPYYDTDGKSCALDNRDLNASATHFGFDVNSLTPIRPDFAADLMSYGSRRWTSDYTWDALYARMDDPTMLLAANSPSAAPESDSIILVSGLITPSVSQGRLHYAWVYPTGALSQRILQKWSTPLDSDPAAFAIPTSQYYVRLLDANGVVLASHAFAPEPMLDGSLDDKSGFNLSLAAPDTPVAQVELLILGSVVHSLHPGENVPSVNILQPSGGETFDQHMTIVWQATDSDVDDRLLYNVQYSPDLGQSWRALVTNWPGLPGADTVTLTLDSLLGLPGSTTGGLLRVAASDGYHTGLATTPAFVVSNQPPWAYIASPAPDQYFEAGKAIMLRGGANDTEEGNVSDEDLAWELDGDSVGAGSELVLAGLAPGDYGVSLSAEDSQGATATEQITMTVSPLYVPDLVWSIEDPELDGFCDDAAYTKGSLLTLKPYPEGNQGAVHLIRTDDYLWACFSGLNRGAAPDAPIVNSAGVVLDANYSREHATQADDYWFYVQEDGTPAVWTGASGVWSASSVEGLQTRISANANAWNAELRIDASALGGWDHAVGLELLHVWVPESGGGHYSWPYTAATQWPDSWATTSLGEWPRIDTLTPGEATEDSGGIIVGVEGDNFESGAVALWNGVPMTTSVVGDSYLLFSVDANNLKLDGAFEVRVQNPGLEQTPSNALTFIVRNPTPVITSLTPDEAEEGAGDMIISVSGSGFDDGAVALWNGEPMTTPVANSTFLMFIVDATELATVRPVEVSVVNPAPHEGRSSVLTFTILAPPNHAPDAPNKPGPEDGSSGVRTNQTLLWQGSDPDGQPLHYDLAFGTSNPPPSVASGLDSNGYNPGRLATNTTYYWRIRASDGLSVTTGPTWSFTTSSVAEANQAPDEPYNPNPADTASDVLTNQALSWRSGDADRDPLTYDVAFGTSNPPPIVQTDLAIATYDPGALDENTAYYWAITVTDGISVTAGPTWRFATVETSYIYLPLALRQTP